MEHRTDAVGRVTLGSAINRSVGLHERADQLAMRARNIADRVGGTEPTDHPQGTGLREPVAYTHALNELDMSQSGLSRALDMLEHQIERLDGQMCLPERDTHGAGSGPQRLRVGER